MKILPSEEQAQCCWALGNSYSAAAARLLQTGNAETFLPTLFLLVHAFELYLKAFLFSQGRSDKELRKIGHDLVACLRACNQNNFRKHVTLSWAQQAQIARINVYYKEKELEYFVPRAKQFGSIDRLSETVAQVAKAVVNPITAETFRVLSQDAT